MSLRSTQSRLISHYNILQELKAQIDHFERTRDNYRKGLETFQDFIELIGELENPKALVNAHIRMGQYCEMMRDIYVAKNAYREALTLEEQIKVDPAHISNLKNKILSLY